MTQSERVRLFIELPEDAVERLLQAFRTGELKHLGVVAVELVPQPIAEAPPDDGPTAWTDGRLYWHADCVELDDDDVETRAVWDVTEARADARCDTCDKLLFGAVELVPPPTVGEPEAATKEDAVNAKMKALANAIAGLRR